jgi:hypothetical protein
MPFASIYSIHPRTNPWNFCGKILGIGGVENLSFFELAIRFFFASSPWKSVIIFRVARMGQNFDDYPDFQKKLRGV